ncbi:MAG: MopE-related protein [Myxococcota bacterium]
MVWLRSVVWMVALTSCVYVGRTDFEERQRLLDGDGDGSPGAEDCNDENPLQSPDIDEIPYDGLDNDCANDGDLIDADGDGFPGISEADYAPFEYPAEFKGLPVDCADDPSVIESAALISPDPNNPEVPYDGLDGKCDRSNDFDADGDGQMPTFVRVEGQRVLVEDAFEAYLDRFGITRQEAERFVADAGGDLNGPNAFADCDDQDPTLFRGNGLEDVIYDGVDSDCDGENDFDADGDGFMPPEFEDDFPAYLNRHWAGGPPLFPVPDVNPFGDCLDTASATFPDLVPADVRPSAPGDPVNDVFGDGLDTDCARNNDFDFDGDGFMAAGTSEAAFADYVVNWGITEAERAAWGAANPDARLVDPPGRNDCDDQNSLVWPGALEVFGGPNDRDCDGRAGAGGLVFGQTAPDAPLAGYAFEGVTNPEIARLGDDFVIVVAGDVLELEAGKPLMSAGVVFPISLQASGQRFQVPDTVGYPQWKATPQQLQGLVDIAVDPAPTDADGDGINDPRIGVLTTQTDPLGVNSTWLVLADVVRLSTNGAFSTPPANLRPLSPSYVPDDIEMGFDAAGDLYGLACSGADARLHAFRRAGLGAAGSSDDPGTLCFVDAPPLGNGDLSIQICDGGACTPWLLDDESTWQVYGNPVNDGITFADEDDGLLMVVDGGEARVEEFGNASIDVLTSVTGTVTQIDAHLDGNDLTVAGLVSTEGGVELWVEQHIGATVETVELGLNATPLSGRTVDAVSVYGDADRSAVAIRGSGASGDVIGWVFMEP